MSHIVKERLQDCSTKEAFLFSLGCEECGEVWKCRPVRFSRAGVVPETTGKQIVFETLYQREKEAAMARAAGEAAGAFNTCPVCHRLVCDHCFLICDDLDLCLSCAERLQEAGELVAVRKELAV